MTRLSLCARVLSILVLLAGGAGLVPAAFGAAPSASEQDRSPAPYAPLFGELSPALSDLLSPGEVPAGALSEDEPPVLARPAARVLAFGERVPRVRCLPYRACSILLGEGETVLHLALGDSERWLVEEVSAPGTRAVLVYKPLAYNLLTDLVVRTDRRLYVIELVSPRPPAGGGVGSEAAYDALVRFRYPGEWSRRVREAPLPSSGGAGGSRVASGPEGLWFEYSFERPLWPRHRLGWVPDVVYDDGVRTYVHLPAEARHRDLPAVLVVGDGGEPAPAAATLGGPGDEWLVVPAVAGRLRLVVGSGRGTRRLTLVREGG